MINRFCKICLSFLVIGLIAVSSRVLAQDLPKAEQVTYKITQFKVPLGSATISFLGEVVENNKKLVLIVFEADGKGFYDKEIIYLDSKTLKPVIVERDVKIFGNDEQIIEKYSDTEVEITKNVGTKTIIERLPINGPVDNLYGFIYRFRQQKQSISIGQSIRVDLPTTSVLMEVLKRHNYAIGGVRRDSFYMRSDPSKYQVWFGADELRIPYKIKGSVGIANTAMEFIDYSVLSDKMKKEIYEKTR